MKSLVVDVSGHGLGHLAQTAVVISRLRARYPNAKILVRSPFAPALVSDFAGEPFECAPLPPEPSLVMKGPLSVDRAASAAAYHDFHERWEEHLAFRVKSLAALQPDLLIANVPYASLAAAARLGVPAVALSPLNWFDMRNAFCNGEDAIAGAIEAAYQSAVVFLQPAPHMPMANLRNGRSIGPICRKGARRAAEMRALLGLGPERRVVLVTLGGVSGEEALELPDDPDFFWILQRRLKTSRRNAIVASDAPMPFIDMLASADAVIGKDGYGAVVEAACNGAPLLMLTRSDWPETPYLVEWGKRHARFAALPHGSGAAALGAALRELLEQEAAPMLEPRGVDEAVEAIAAIAQL